MGFTCKITFKKGRIKRCSSIVALHENLLTAKVQIQTCPDILCVSWWCLSFKHIILLHVHNKENKSLDEMFIEFHIHINRIVFSWNLEAEYCIECFDTQLPSHLIVVSLLWNSSMQGDTQSFFVCMVGTSIYNNIYI